MKVILGINAYHADASACIIVDGELIAAIEEERMNRLKHYSGYPISAIKPCTKATKGIPRALDFTSKLLSLAIVLKFAFPRGI